MAGRNTIWWIIWLTTTVLIGLYLGYRLNSDDKTVFLPGSTTDGHYQIELACNACHREPFGGTELIQGACVDCHGQELKQADDSHPKSKFTDPRNASRVAKLDARLCVTCHTEHKPTITTEMAVTVTEDVCLVCHKDIAEDRPSHKGMAFDTCASAGCHNFHDNRALYEDFLAKHMDEPVHLAQQQILKRSTASEYVQALDYPLDEYPLKVLKENDSDAPPEMLGTRSVMADWMSTTHAKVGVNCSACHEQQLPGNTSQWLVKPDLEQCTSCHQYEAKGFLTGKHGMRQAQKLTPMQPEWARQPMHTKAHGKSLTCNSCHSAHRYDVNQAAVESCLGCHDDKHSQAYKASSHFKAWGKEMTGEAEPGSGVSCATCHLPRSKMETEQGYIVIAQHNQNDNLRPNEKMLRSVCMQCHGLGFAIDALADQGLIEENFARAPLLHIESIELVKKRIQQKKSASAGGG